MPKLTGLGRGLSALLPDADETLQTIENRASSSSAIQDAVTEIPIALIDPNRNQPRHHFPADTLQSLSDSIRENGILSPILVAKDGNRYTIIAGERRWRAAQLAGLSTVPVIIRDWDNIRRQEAALIENIQREDLNAIEEANGISRLMTSFGMTQETIAKRLGKSRSVIANSVRLLSLPDDIQQSVINNEISSGHARVLAGISDPSFQHLLYEQTLLHHWSVRQLEEASKKKKAGSTVHPHPTLPAEYNDLCDRLRTATGCQVHIAGSEKKGRIVLEYSSEEDLQKIWDLLES